MGQKVSVEKIRAMKDAKGGNLYSAHFEAVLLDVQCRAYEQYPFLEEGLHSCTVTDNSLEDNPIIWINDEFERMTLFPRDEIIGHNCRFLQGPGTNREVVTSIKDALKNGVPIDVDLLNYRKDGVAFWNNFRILPVWSRARVWITHFIAVQNDVTLTKQPGRYYQQWTPEEVGGWLVSIDLGDFSKIFMQKGHTGKSVVDVTEQQLKEMGMSRQEIEIYVQERRELVAGKLKEVPRTIPSKEDTSSTVAVKCYLDGKAKIYTVPRKTSLSKFQKTLKRDNQWEFTMRVASDTAPVTSSSWSKRLSKSKGTLVVFLTRNQEAVDEELPRTRMSASSSFSSTSSPGNSLDLFNSTGGAQFSAALFLSQPSTFTELLKIPGAEDSTELADGLYNLFDSRGRIGDLMTWAITHELIRISGFNEFLRSQSCATRLIYNTVRSEPAIRYLWHVMQPVMKDVLANQNDIEGKPLEGNRLLQHLQWTGATCEKMVDRLCKSIDFCPLSLREVTSAIVTTLEDHPERECVPREMALISLALRYIVPAFADPSQFEHLVGTLSMTQTKALRQFSIFVQKMCNNIPYPEEDNSAVLNPVIESCRPRLLKYVTEMTDVKEIKMHRKVMMASITPVCVTDMEIKLNAAIAALRMEPSSQI